MNIYSDQYKYSIYNCIMVMYSITEVSYVYVTWLVVCMYVYISDQVAKVYIVSGLQPGRARMRSSPSS